MPFKITFFSPDNYRDCKKILKDFEYKSSALASNKKCLLSKALFS